MAQIIEKGLCVILKEYGLWKYLNRTAIHPVDEDVKRYELHFKKSDLTYSLIVKCIDKGHYIGVRHTESTKDAWNALIQHYKKVLLYQQTVWRQNNHSVRFQLGSNIFKQLIA